MSEAPEVPAATETTTSDDSVDVKADVGEAGAKTAEESGKGPDKVADSSAEGGGPPGGGGGGGGGQGGTPTSKTTAAEPSSEFPPDDDDDGVVFPEGYKPPAKVGLQDIVKADAEDESLKRYKEAILGKDIASGKVAESKDPRKVIIVDIRLRVSGRDDIIIPLSTPAEQKSAAETTYIFKQGVEFQTIVRFRVQHDIVVGLAMTNSVYRRGLRMDRQVDMIGSFPPKSDIIEHRCPPDTWPKGFMSRALYVAKVKFTDDDKTTHLECAYKFEIKKGWE